MLKCGISDFSQITYLTQILCFALKKDKRKPLIDTGFVIDGCFLQHSYIINNYCHYAPISFIKLQHSLIIQNNGM